MDRQIVEISQDDFTLSLYRGFLHLENKDIKHDVALDNILSLILSAHNVLLSKNVVNALSEQGACIIFCGKDYLPTSITMPYVGHWLVAPRVRCQIEVSKSLHKQLWKSIVQHKILNQAIILNECIPSSSHISRLQQLSKETLSDDSTNTEGMAASIYFKALFGLDFVRNRLSPDINMLLNYIYIVLRAVVARAVAGAGLLPYIGIKHRSKTNTLPLIDDLMEPFRPLADRLVFDFVSNNENNKQLELTPDIKRYLTQIVTVPMQTLKGKIPLNEAVYEFVNTLVLSFEEEKVLLRYPDIIL